MSNQSNPQQSSNGGYHGGDKNGLRYYDIDEAGSNLLSEMNSYHEASLLSVPSNKWRAKLYQLNTQGSWDDFGTGEFSIVKDVSTGTTKLTLS